MGRPLISIGTVGCALRQRRDLKGRAAMKHCATLLRPSQRGSRRHDAGDTSFACVEDALDAAEFPTKQPSGCSPGPYATPGSRVVMLG